MKKRLKVEQEFDVRGLIDRFGEVSERLRELEAEKERLREELIARLGEGRHVGRHYVVDISKKIYRTLSPEKVLKKLGSMKTFLKVVSINLTNLKKYVAEEDIEDLVEAERETLQVSVRKIANGV